MYNRRDVLLYALGVGAEELRFTYELGTLAPYLAYLCCRRAVPSRA